MTLIELILVMGVLATVMALVGPSLSSFFAGRRLQEEGRRLLALTRYARSEAVSRSAALEVYLDPKAQSYSVRARSQADSDNRPPLEYQLADGLTLDIDPAILNAQGEALISFLPDGSIDEGSVASVSIKESADKALILERAAVGVGYLLR